MKKIKIYCVIFCISLLLAGCKTQHSGSDNRQEEPASTVDSQAGLSDASKTGDNEDGQIPFLDNPTYNPNGRQVLTVLLAVPFHDDLEKIFAFNASNPDYYIEMKFYDYDRSIDSTEADRFETLETQLSLEILTGKGPDIVMWNYYYTPSLASEKLMENMYDLMEADPDFHREDYYENILQAFESDGGLYILPSSFSIKTMFGKVEELGKDRGITESWELGEMLEAYKNSPHADMFSSFYNKEYTLSSILTGCMGNFVDWESGKCYFDTPAFIEFLEFCNTLPEGFEDIPVYDYFHEGKIFCGATSLWVPWDVAAERIWFGEDLLWPGYPVADGEKDLGGGVASPWGESFSICKNSGNQEAAWGFLKSFLTADAQREVKGIPLLRSVSEERVQEALAIEYETVGGIEQEKTRHEIILSERGDTIGLTHITEQDAERYRSIIENTYRSSGSDPGMMEIIMEEAEVYFKGGKDAATVADIIQNRVSMYVGERMN